VNPITALHAGPARGVFICMGFEISIDFIVSIFLLN